MNARSQYQNRARGATSAPIEEELETGEPIHEEESRPNIPQTSTPRPWANGRREEQADQTEQTKSQSSGAGQMVLSSAKYLKKNTDPEIEAENRKKQQAERAMRGGAGGGAHSFEKGVFNSGMLGGMLAMGGAVVWFVAGLAMYVIFFYPPILFVIGLAAFFKGLMGGNNQE